VKELDDTIIKVRRSVSSPTSNHSGDDPISHFGDHNAQNNENKGLKAQICCQASEYTELVQEAL